MPGYISDTHPESESRLPSITYVSLDTPRSAEASSASASYRLPLPPISSGPPRSLASLLNTPASNPSSLCPSTAIHTSSPYAFAASTSESPSPFISPASPAAQTWTSYRRPTGMRTTPSVASVAPSVSSINSWNSRIPKRARTRSAVIGHTSTAHSFDSEAEDDGSARTIRAGTESTDRQSTLRDAYSRFGESTRGAESMGSTSGIYTNRVKRRKVFQEREILQASVTDDVEAVLMRVPSSMVDRYRSCYKILGERNHTFTSKDLMCARCQSRPTMRMKDDTVRPVFGCNVKVKEDDSGPALISGKLVCAECRIAGTSCKWNGMGIVERYNRSRVLASGVEDKEEDDAGDLIPIPSTDDLGYKTSCEELAEASVELDCRSTSNSETASGSFLPAGTVGPLVLSGPVEQQKEYPRTQANTALSVVDVEPLATAESIPPDPVHTSLRPTWNPRKTQIMWKPALELIRSTMRSLLRLDPIEYVLLERSRVVEHPDILNQQIGMLGTETNSLLAQLAVRVSAVSSMVIDSGANKEPEFTIPDGLGQGNLTKHFEVLIERWLRQETVTLKDDVKDVIDSIPWDLVKIQAFFASATHGL